MSTKECPLCSEDVFESSLLKWGVNCTHSACPLCTLRYLHEELSVPEENRIRCYLPDCTSTLSLETLESCINSDPSVGPPLGPGAVARARHRVSVVAREGALRASREALGSEGGGMAERLKNCPSKSCLTGIICCEPSEDGLGRLCLCDVCSEEVCGTCGTLWNGRLPILSHRGVRCAMILLIRD